MPSFSVSALALLVIALGGTFAAFLVFLLLRMRRPPLDPNAVPPRTLEALGYPSYSPRGPVRAPRRSHGHGRGVVRLPDSSQEMGEELPSYAAAGKDAAPPGFTFVQEGIELVDLPPTAVVRQGRPPEYEARIG